MEPLKAQDPRQIGRYRIESRLGSGGMGQVFLGFSPAGRRVAVKVVHPELARDRAFLSRFRQEVSAARKVSGAYTAPVVDAGDGDGDAERPWLATTLVMGPSLADAVEQQGPLPEISVWRLAAGLAEALAEVHSCGLVHRDLKPSNVLLAADGPRVIDFGISRALDGTALTGTGMLVGTPAFMSPEQANGTPVGPASDVFSYGGVLTFAATGSGPFGDGSAPAMIYRVVHGEPMLADLPAALADVVGRCLAKRPEERPSLGELMEIFTVRPASVYPVMSFWPPALADYIASYQASITEASGTSWPSAAGPAWPAAGHGDQDGSATVTGQATPPSPPPAVTSLAAATSLAAPPDGAQSLAAPDLPQAAVPADRRPRRPLARRPYRPRRPRRRGALVAGIGALGAVVIAIAVVLATSPSPGKSPGRAALRSTVGHANPQPPGGYGAIPPESGTPHPGTVSFALPVGAAPNWILPLASDTYEAVNNVLDFSYEMWRPLYWPDQGAAAAIDPTLSLARAPAWSDGGKTVTVTMNPRYTWSDGTPVAARDVAFDIDLIKAAVKESPADWAVYNPGYFPDDVASMSTPDSGTLVLHLKSAVNPSWFYQDELEALQPMPAHAWARDTAGGPILDFTNPANAKKIYDYLFAQSKLGSTWTANPLWRVVDGPFRLLSYEAGQGDTMVANPRYGGPSSHKITTLTEVTYPSDAAEFSAMRAGLVDVGLVPSEDVSRLSQVTSAGYNAFGYPDFGWTYEVYNFKDTTGYFDRIVAQLYFRQAMAHLQDQQGDIRSFMYGAGSQGYGPVPPIPASQYTPANATNTYPFSVATARQLLTAHGWKVIPNGTDTCVRPGAGAGECGTGIPAGTELSFNLSYADSPAVIGQEVKALTATAKQAGITITTKSNTLANVFSQDNDVISPANANDWAMDAFGSYTQVAYPTTITVFNTDGSLNVGGYSAPEADRLIYASVTSADPDAVTNEAAYLTAQQPALFGPTPDSVYVWKKTLSGPPDSFASLTQYYLTPEVWYFTR